MNFKNLIFMATLGCSSYIGAQNNVNINGTTGNVSLNTPTSSAGPSPLSIYGGNTFSSQGWQHGLTMYNHGTIAFANTTQSGVQSTFFMGAPSGTPLGDFYFGTVPSINGGSNNGPVVYAFKVYGQNPVPGTLNLPGSREKASTHFFTNTYIKSTDGTVGYFGVNTLEPKRVVDIVSKRPQLRITAIENNNPNLGVHTDFNTQNFGLNIIPMRNGIRRTVFVHRGGSTIQATRLVVNGNGRFRYIPQGNADCLILGRHNQGGANDNTFRRLEFTGNTNDVLLGNGTWGQVNTVACWDTNGDGIQDPSEDINNDGVWDALDCQGPQGPQGNVGPQGPAGFSTGAHNGTSMSTIDPTKVAFGNDLGGTASKLLNDREIPMNDNYLLFTGQSVPMQGNQISIGYTDTILPAKLSVIQIAPVNVPENSITGSFVNYDVASNTNLEFIGLQAKSLGIQNQNKVANIGGDFTAKGSNTNIGVRCDINYSGSQVDNFGVSSRVTGSSFSNTGGIFYSQDGTVSNLGIVGVGISSGTGISWGGVFRAGGSDNQNTSITATTVSYNSNAINTGVRAVAQGGINNYGIYSVTYPINSTSYAGYFQGNLHATGQISSTNGTIIASDQQFKTNVNNLTNSLDLINQLQPKTFYYDTTGYADFDFETDQQMGLIAQEVEQVIPTLVTNLTRPEQFDTLGNSIAPQIDYKGVEYGELIPLLIGGIQEQQAIITTQDSTINVQDSLITDLNNRLTTLENCLSNLLPLLCQINNNMIQQNDAETQKQLNNMLNIELSDDTESIVLNQNVPNPFAEQTTITYTIPATVQKAQIHFYDQNGKLIRTVEINERGNGRINVFASDLSSGIYTYTLVADGQIIASKRMVKTN